MTSLVCSNFILPKGCFGVCEIEFSNIGKTSQALSGVQEIILLNYLFCIDSVTDSMLAVLTQGIH